VQIAQSHEQRLGPPGEPSVTQLPIFAQFDDLRVVDQFTRELVTAGQAMSVAETHDDQAELLAEQTFDMDLRHREPPRRDGAPEPHE